LKIAFFNSKTGSTLIELMIALLIIATIVLAGGMFFFHGRVHTVREARRRAAVLVASERLEALKAALYTELAPGSFVPVSPYWIVWDETLGWDFRESFSEDFYDEVTVENLAGQKMFTEAQYIDEDGGGADYSKVTVTVDCQHHGTTDTVSSTTLIAP